MSKRYFINRHGKRLNVDEDVSDQPTVSEVKPSVTRSDTPKVRRKISFPRIKISKKVSVVLIFGVFALLLVALLMVDTARRDYQLQTAGMKSSVREQTSQTASTETSANEIIKSLTKQLNAKSSCESSGFFLEKYYSPAREAQVECQTTAMSYTKLQTALSTALEAVTYIDKQKSVMSEALSHPTDGVFAEIPQEAQTWSKAYDDLQKLDPPQVVRSSHDRLVIGVMEVTASWKELQQAQNSQSTEAFTVAEAKLAKAYEGIRTSGDDFTLVINQLQIAIIEAANELR